MTTHSRHLGTIRLAAAPKGQHSQVVEAWDAVGKRPHVVKAGVDQLGRLPRGLLVHQCHDAVHAVLTGLVAGFRKTVRVKEERVAGFELNGCGGKLRFEEHPQRHTGRFNTKHATTPNDDCWAVAGVMDFYLSGRLGQPAYPRGV